MSCGKTTGQIVRQPHTLLNEKDASPSFRVRAPILGTGVGVPALAGGPPKPAKAGTPTPAPTPSFPPGLEEAGDAAQDSVEPLDAPDIALAGLCGALMQPHTAF